MDPDPLRARPLRGSLKGPRLPRDHDNNIYPGNTLALAVCAVGPCKLEQ